MVLSPCLEKKKIVETKEHESIAFDLSSPPNEFTNSLSYENNEKSEKSDTKTEENFSENGGGDDDNDYDEYLDKILNNSDMSKSNRNKNSIANNKSNDDDDEFKLNLSDDVMEVEKFDEELIRISKNESTKEIMINNKNESSNSSKQKNKNNKKFTNKNDKEYSTTTSSHKEESSSRQKINKV